jgi:type VI secretion system secreted protein VgrG
MCAIFQNQGSSMTLDLSKTIQTLVGIANQSSQGKCALHIRLALDAGGIQVRPTLGQAKLYDPVLSRYGFKKSRYSKGVLIDSSSCKNYSPEAGDIAVIPNVAGGRPEGHIAMFTGKEWISDFKQRDMWGGPIYRKADPDVAIYRFSQESQ